MIETDHAPVRPGAELAKALVKARKDFKPIRRTHEVRVRTRAGGEYTFRYAPFESLVEATDDALTDNGIYASQTIHDGRVVTALIHESGQMLQSRGTRVICSETVSSQEYGAAVTYARRYDYALLLNLCADDDHDGHAPNSAGDLQGIEKRQEQREQDARRVGREEPVASDPSKFTGDWREVVMHWETPKFKVKGKKLGELEPRQLKFLQDKWNPKPSPRGGFIAKEDRILRAALDKSMEPEKTTVPPPVDTESDELPMFNGPNHQSLYERLQAEWINPQRFTETMITNGALPDGVTFGNVTNEQAKGFLDDWENVEAAMKAAAK